MKAALTELIERLEEKIKICNSNNLEREAMGMIEAKAIATELLEKERDELPRTGQQVIAYTGEYPHLAWYNDGWKCDAPNGEPVELKGVTEWFHLPKYAKQSKQDFQCCFCCITPDECSKIGCQKQLKTINK